MYPSTKDPHISVILYMRQPLPVPPPKMGMVKPVLSPPPQWVWVCVHGCRRPPPPLWLWYVVVMVCDCGCIALHCNCIALHCSAVHCIALIDCLALHCIASPCIAWHCIAYCIAGAQGPIPIGGGGLRELRTGMTHTHWGGGLGKLGTDTYIRTVCTGLYI